MRFRIRYFVLKQSNFTAMFPYRGKQGSGATEDRISIRPGRDHLSYDVGCVGIDLLRDIGRIGCWFIRVNRTRATC